MTSPSWSLVEFAARPLDRDEREAVLGDSIETGESASRALFAILGLVIRRQILLWKSWRPWLSVFIIGVPCTVLLMGVSVSVTCTVDRLMGLKMSHWAPTGHEGCALLLCHISLLIACSWATGFTLGSLSSRTLWLNASLGMFLAFVYSSHMLNLLAVSRFAAFLFLVPAISGVHQGISANRLRLGPAFLLTATMAVLMFSAWVSSALWIYNWLLLCPALYLLATARQPNRN